MNDTEAGLWWRQQQRRAAQRIDSRRYFCHSHPPRLITTSGALQQYKCGTAEARHMRHERRKRHAAGKKCVPLPDP